MDFKELEYMIVIAQEKSISKAAERLYVSQPALSRFLLKLEDRLGLPLFIRKNRQYFPTYAGELYLETARNILKMKQGLDADLKNLKQAKGGILTLGITPGRGRTILPKILPCFHEAFPEYELKLFEESVDMLERYLSDGTIEIAFFTIHEKNWPTGKRIKYELIAREEIVLCTSKDDTYLMLARTEPGRKYPWIDLRLLKNENFLLLKNSMRLGQFAASAFEKHQMDPKTVELSSIDTALALVGQNYGVAFASSFRLEEHTNAGEMNFFSFGESEEKWDFVAAYQQDYEIKKAAGYLIKLMAELYSDGLY